MANRTYSDFPERKMEKPREYTLPKGEAKAGVKDSGASRPNDVPGYKAQGGPVAPGFNEDTKPMFKNIRVHQCEDYDRAGAPSTRYKA